jgi:hypothetical protein
MVRTKCDLYVSIRIPGAREPNAVISLANVLANSFNIYCITETRLNDLLRAQFMSCCVLCVYRDDRLHNL